MPDWTAAAPQEPNKIGDYLHGRERIPDAPDNARSALVENWAGLAAGTLLGLGLAAVGFEVRDSWKEHRDWVVPIIALAGIFAGLGIGHLLGRGKFAAAGPAILFAILAVAFAGFDIWRGEVLDGESDAGRVTLGVFAAIFLGLSAASAIVAVLYVETKQPTQPPEAEA